MIIKKTEKGQALIVVTLAAIVLFAFAALTIDFTRVFSDKRHAQNAADTAALAAALAKIRGQNFSDAALLRAASNGYNNNGTTNLVQVNLCSESGITCAGLPSGLTTEQKAEYIRVSITSTLPGTFSRVIGRQAFTTTSEAITRVQGTTTATSGSLFGGAAMFATNKTKPQAFLLNGNADVEIHDSCIFVNSNSNTALLVNGGKLIMDCNATVVGNKLVNGTPTITPGVSVNQTSAQIDVSASTFASVPTTLAPPTCSNTWAQPPTGGSVSYSSGNATVSGGTVTFSPGKYNNIMINSGTASFTEGAYCIAGNFNVNAGSITGPGGRVKFVIYAQGINISGSGTHYFKDIEIYANNGNFTLNGNVNFSADRLRFFSVGAANFIFNSSSSSLTSGDAYLYLKSGQLIWNGGTKVNLHAPPQGDPFAGLLIHLPWGNTQNIILNGDSNVHLVGTYLAPTCPMTFNGGNNFELHSQLIADSFIVNGGGATDIYYVASENYGAADVNDPTIELTK